MLSGGTGGGGPSKGPLVQKSTPSRNEDESAGGSNLASENEGEGRTDRCALNIDKKICDTHGCELSEIKVTTTKWAYIERKKCYGNVKRKVIRGICRSKNNTLIGPTISTIAKSSDNRIVVDQISEGSGDLHNALE